MESSGKRLALARDGEPQRLTGNQRTAAMLAKLTADHVVLHTCQLPLSRNTVDHVVIGPSGITLVDSRTYAGYLRIGDDAVWNGRRPLKREIARQQLYVDKVAEILPTSLAATVRSLVCVYEATMAAARISFGPVSLVGPETLVAVIVNAETSLSTGKIKEVADLLQVRLSHI